MRYDFDTLYMIIYEKIEDLKLKSLLAELYEEHFKELIVRDIEFMLYKGYSRNEVIEELKRMYDGEININLVKDVIDTMMN